MKAERLYLTLLLLVVLAGACLRFFFLATMVIDTPFRNDAKQYAIYAVNLADHNTFSLSLDGKRVPDSLRSPGYPFFLSLLIRAVGRKFVPIAFFLQAFMSALVILFTWLIAREFLPHPASLAASVLVALSPHLVTINGYLLTESLALFFLTCALLFFVFGQRRSSRGMVLTSGLLFGMLAMINEGMLPLGIIVALAALLSGWRPGRVTMAGFVALWLVFPLAWQARNMSLPQGAVSGSSRLRNTITHGSYPGFIYKSQRYKYFSYHEDPEQPEYASSWSKMFEIWTRRASERPWRYLSWYLLEKPFHLWNFPYLQGTGIYIYPVYDSIYHHNNPAAASKTVLQLLHPLCMIFFLVGVILGIREARVKKDSSPAWLISAIVLYPTILYTIAAPWPRYTVPFKPLFYLLAIWGMVRMVLFFTDRLRSVGKSFPIPSAGRRG